MKRVRSPIRRSPSNWTRCSLRSKGGWPHLFDADQLTSFTAAVFFLVLLPGPNTMVILAHSLAGRAAGLATVAGVELGTMIHTLAVAVGLSALLSTSPAAFAAVKYAGVAYLLCA